jgi:4-hydroxybenzoate polyprenyltransferase
MDRGIGSEPAGPQASPAARIPERPNPADYLFILRPMILIPVWTFFLLGAAHGSRAAGTPVDSRLLLAGAACFTAVVGAAYIINQITDRATDRAAGKLFLVSHGIVSLPAAWAEAGLLAAAGVGISAAFLPPALTLILAAGALLGAAYSLEPVRLKRRPVLDVLANALANGVLNTLAGWAAIGASIRLAEPAGLAVLAPYPLAVAAVHLSTTLADIDGDRAAGLRTSGTALGRRAGILLSAILMAASCAASALVGNMPALYASSVSLLFFIVTAVSERRGRPGEGRSGDGILLPAKVSTLAFSVAAGVFFPAYFGALALTIILTRIYYSRRFGMRYPSL